MIRTMIGMQKHDLYANFAAYRRSLRYSGYAMSAAHRSLSFEAVSTFCTCPDLLQLRQATHAYREMLRLPLIDVLTRHFRHRDENLRQKAVQALVHLYRGSPQAIAKVKTYLGHRGRRTRFAAVCCLGQLATRGDQDTIAALSMRIEDPDVDVRRAAVQALLSVANQGDSHVIVDLLERTHADVRMAAVGALRQRLETVNGDAITASCARPDDTDAEFRLASVQALSQLDSDDADSDVVAALKSRPEDADVEVRRAAVQAFLPKLANDEQVDNPVIADLVEHTQADFRMAAAGTLGQRKTGVTQEVITALCARLGDTDAEIRLATVQALTQLDHEDVHSDVVAALYARLEDTHADVRIAAVVALVRFGKDDERTRIIFNWHFQVCRRF